MQVAAAYQQPPTRADYYDYQQRTQRMGPQTMMGGGMAPTTVSQYPQAGGYPPDYQQGYNGGGYDNGDSEQRGGRRWVAWVIAAVVVVAAIIAAFFVIHGSGGSGAYVPTGLVGEPQATAVAQIKAAGLSYTVHQQTDANVTQGDVISTDPGSGASIAKGGTVAVYVSQGVGTITLPTDLSGQSAANAQTQLKNLGFTNVTEATDAGSTLQSGDVDHVTPSAGGKYAPNTLITLYISGGGTPVPNVSNGTESYEEAQQILTGDGFKVTLSSIAATSGTYAPGVVYNQNPPPNSVEPKGSNVTIFYQPLNATPTPTPSVTTSSPTTTPTPTLTPSTTVTPTQTPTSTGTPPGA
jgi:beta-lactam-binding protein with PASTA domain